MPSVNPIPTNPKFIDLTGCAFGRWVVQGFVEQRGKASYWLCRCSCGTEKIVGGNCLRMGQSSSCGCLKRELASKRFIKHGCSRNRTHTPEYNSWASMISRCTNPRSTQFKNYGKRGVGVCQSWLNSFEEFLADMGVKPSRNHSLDRIDNNGNYEPKNCRWATQKQQASNTRRNRKITYKKECLTITQWAERTGLHRNVISRRLSRGWSVERTLAT